MKIVVKGHSGCQINLVNEQDAVFVYKSADNAQYGKRLIAQANKQQEASKSIRGAFYVPKIVSVEHDERGARIKMEYVYSKNFIDFFEEASFEQVLHFCEDLIFFIEKEVESSTLSMIDPQIILRKYEDVKRHFKLNPNISNDKEVKEIILQSSTVFFTRKRFLIPLGPCHGDLTLSNILFTAKGYCLIDFLDSFLESPLIDIVKIRQDSFFHWSPLLYDGCYDRIRFEIISATIDRAIDEHFKRYDWYEESYTIFQLLNLLRVLQYANEANVIGALKTDIFNILDEF